MNEEQAKIRASYYKAHRCCPKCGSDRIFEGTVGYGVGFCDDAIDENQAYCCSCKWKGIVNDLVPPKGNSLTFPLPTPVNPCSLVRIDSWPRRLAL